uniref:Uncharacterized protein n=1 Tax=Cucumis melo TaxID=3656 RepID=A0A9I9EEY2_CUCME
MIIDPRRSLSSVDLSNKLLSWPSIPYLPSIKGQRLLHSLCIGADFVRVPNLGFVFMIGAREWICGRLRPMIVPIAILLGEFGWWSLSDDPDLPGRSRTGFARGFFLAAVCFLLVLSYSQFVYLQPPSTASWISLISRRLCRDNIARHLDILKLKSNKYKNIVFSFARSLLLDGGDIGTACSLPKVRCGYTSYSAVGKVYCSRVNGR